MLQGNGCEAFTHWVLLFAARCCRLQLTQFAVLLPLAQAYAQGMFPPNTSSKDFIRIDGSKHNSADGWTPEETML